MEGKICPIAHRECIYFGRCNLNAEDCVYLDDPDTVLLGDEVFDVLEDGTITRYDDDSFSYPIRLGTVPMVREERESDLEGTQWAL